MFEKYCPVCKTKLSKKHKKCPNCFPPRSNNKEERHRRKALLVEMLGGKCIRCGYNRSIFALSFHHKDSKTKQFDISNNGNILKDWNLVVSEAKKCELLCLNCHAETHKNSKDS